MKSKNTKRALLTSVLSMLLCVAMLVGSTFAWFTDSVTSGKNKIVAGNLDVELYHDNGNASEEKVEADTKLFVNSDGSDILWEPGVMVYENFTVKNVGSLALKYQLTVNADKFNTVAGTDKSLKDVLKVAILDEAFSGDRAAAQALTFDKTIADFAKEGNIAAQAADDTYAIVVYWEPSDVDNDYNLNNGKTSSDGEPLFIDLGVNLVATQDTVENDSFDNQYDKDAGYPVSFNNFESALEKGGSLSLTEDITITSPGNNPTILTMADGTVLDLNGKTINSEHNMGLILQGKNASIKNGSFVGLNGASYALFVGDEGETDNVVIENVTMQGGVNVYNSSKVVLRDCEIHGTNYYAVWADQGAEVIIESGTYYAGKVSVLNSSNVGTIIVKGGSFDGDPSAYVDTDAYDVTLDQETNMYVVTPKI